MLRKPIPWLLVALLALAILARILPGPRTIDDAFITFRYARNLLAGNGFAFNPGEQVLGTTTPLFTLLLATLALPFGGAQADFPRLALLVSALADGLTTVLLYALGRKLGSPAAGLAAALVWVIAPFSVTFAIGGLETSVYVLCLVALMWAYLDGRLPAASGLAAAAVLTRPDGLLLVALLLVWHGLSSRPNFLKADFWRSGRYQNLKAVLLFLLPLLAWALFAWLYFGSPLPQSVQAKSEAYRVGPLDGLVRLLQHYGTPLLEHLTFGTGWLKIGLWLYPFLSLLGALAAWRRQPGSLPFAVFPWLHFAAFAIANPLLFRWYLTPPLPFYFLFIGLGVHKLAGDLRRRFNVREPRWSQALAALMIVLPVLSSLRGWTLKPDPPSDRPAPEMAFIRLEQLYAEAATWLQPRLAASPRSVRLAAADVGVLGYYLADTPILDLLGLNSKESLPYYPIHGGDFVYAIPPDLVMAERPDYVVIMEIYGRDGLLLDPRFQGAYVRIHSWPTDIYGSDGLAIYQRSH